MTTRCETCDRPRATAEEWDTMQPGEGPGLCWGEPGCTWHEVDWRERALRAEQLSETLAEQCRELAATVSARAGDLSALRTHYTALVRAHLSGSDAERIDAMREATARVEGWGM